LEYVLTDGRLTGVRYSENGEEKIVNCDGVFLAVGLIPDNDRFTNVADLDQRGYFKTDEYGLTRTSNVFVAGDCRSKNLRQVATACSDGANAAIEACRYLG
ncbi:MAG: FAD-dependent oxidoreductase, partial [Erysipelotrichaceae bacterium]|nr:FAD-dependent oxidoreductase [Erysipelotrichaceae bacterium]